MAKTRSPYQLRRTRDRSPRPVDSPSKQLLLDLERALSQLEIHQAEIRKVRAFQRRSYCEGVQAWDWQRLQADCAALEVATARHDAIRNEAEVELQKHYAKVEAEEKRTRDEAERKERERLALEKAIREYKAREEAERQAKLRAIKEAEEKKHAEEKAKVEAAARAAREQKEAAEREKAEKERKKKEKSEREEAEKRAAEQQATQAAAKAAADSQVQHHQLTGLASPELEAQHARYLDIHKNLKNFRSEFIGLVKADRALKSKVGDMRRAMRTSVGQLTDSKEKGANKKATDRVKETLLSALKDVPSKPVNLTPYIYLDSNLLPTETTIAIPSLLLYLINMFSKAVISAFTNEAAVNTRAAEPIGVLVAACFALPDLQIPYPATTTHPPLHSVLFSILLSKLHATCPPLFGISGPESTQKGLTRLGWRHVSASEGATKSPISSQTHYDRMTGIAAGFAAISLRNFSRTKLHNPYPPVNYWSSLSHILNTPPERMTTTHLVVLKNMLEGGVERFILFYGAAAVAVVRAAVVQLPPRLPPHLGQQAAGRAVGLLAETWKREKNFAL